MSKPRIRQSQREFRDGTTGLWVNEYRVSIEGASELLVRLSARLTREQASDVVFHLRGLIDDVSAEAGLDQYERVAREELLAACHVFRKERTDPHDMEDAKARLHSVAFLLSAVESNLEAAR